MNDSMFLPKLHVIIPAGGAGTRLWPLSRVGRPKFLLDPVGQGQSLIQSTVERLKPLALSITVVTGEKHYDEVCRQLPELAGAPGADAFPGEILVEPSPRDSMAAIGYAAYILRDRYGESAIIGSFAADHLVVNQEAFRKSIEETILGAQSGYLTTIGVIPTEPSPAYGYIHPQPEAIGPDLYRVVRFVEKPDEARAEEYLTQGYLWNAGIFVVQAGVLAKNLAQKLPQMDQTLKEISRQHSECLIETGEVGRVDPILWDKLTKIAIDFALAEPLAAEGSVAVVRAQADLGWSDIGDFAVIGKLWDRDNDQNVLRVDAQNALVLRSKSDGENEQMIAVVGIDDAIIVQTKDALLVTVASRAQQVKEAVDQIRLERPDLL